MLWRKENAKQLDSLYVDLCDLDDEKGISSSFFDDDDDDSSSSDDSIESAMPSKCDALSKHYRQKASAQCELKNWFEAIELYNEALCFVDCDSSEWAGILADRASCFFQMKLFDECLTDAKLAKKKPGAANLMAKLDRLIAVCGQKKHQRGNNEKMVSQFKPSLSFDANKAMPFAANAITIAQKNKKKTTTASAAKLERFFQATRSIDVGRTILIEDAFVATTIERYKRCCICMKSATNLVPCTECTNSLFCHGTCERKAGDFHCVECNASATNSKNDQNNADLAIRSILMAFRMFSTVNGLLLFVEKVLFDKQYDALATDFGITAKSKYAIFLKNGQKMLHMFDEDGKLS